MLFSPPAGPPLSEPGELARATSCVRFAAERAAEFSTRTCIAVHGGIGVTWEHDAPYYWRRAQLSRLLVGGGAGAADRVADEVIAAARRRSNNRISANPRTPAGEAEEVAGR